MIRTITLSPDDAGGGDTTVIEPPSWQSTLPEDLRENATLKTIPDVATLAKMAVDQQHFIGLKRLESPQESWDDAKWGAHYNNLGRPETHDKYEVPEMNLPEGVELKEERVTKAKEAIHKLGLSGKQYQGVMSLYGNMLSEDVKSVSDTEATTASEATMKLREEWGDKYDRNSDLASAAMKKFGSPDFVEWLSTSGQGNNPEMVKIFAEIGTNLVEDTVGGTSGSGMTIQPETQAQLDIDSLKLDEGFQKALTTREHPGHDAALARWRDAFNRAYPGKQQE
jgi:hypothetical protein